MRAASRPIAVSRYLVDALTGADACRRNRDWVVDLCERADVSYFVIPEARARRFRIAVPEDSWDEFVSELLAYGRQTPLYLGVEAVSPARRSRRWTALSLNPDAARAARTQRYLEVFRIMSASRHDRLLGRPWSCVVERWSRDDANALVAPTKNSCTTYIGTTYQQPVTKIQASRRVRTFQSLAERDIFDVDFPIDVVYMWVDGSDPRWQARKRAALRENGITSDATAASEERFRESGELKYSLRSVERHMPWVRRIFLVTDRQTPAWLSENSVRLEIVDHKQLFGKSGRLPSFNSHAIGARLHHIPGLSEHYLHFNDDFFVGRDLLPGTFFQSNGGTKFFLSRSTLPFSNPGSAPEHEAARRNVVELLVRDFGRRPTRVFFHTPIAQRRSTLYELEARYPAEFNMTWQSQFRSRQDYEINSWLHHYYSYLIGRAVPGSIKYDYFDLSSESVWRRMRRVARIRQMDVFCVNDSADADEVSRERAMQWLAAYYPGKSAFER